MPNEANAVIQVMKTTQHDINEIIMHKHKLINTLPQVIFSIKAANRIDCTIKLNCSKSKPLHKRKLDSHKIVD